MVKYSNEDIRSIISDVRLCAFINNKTDEIVCQSAEEFIRDLSEYAKYVIPEKREKWCELLRSVVYDIPENMPIVFGKNNNLKSQVIEAIKNHDNKIYQEILSFIYSLEIMESKENHNINDVIKTLESMNLSKEMQNEVIKKINEFSALSSDILSNERKQLESRLVFTLKVKATLEEYKNYCIEHYYWECDNTEEKRKEKRERLARIGDERLLEIVNNTYLFAGFLIKLMKDENNTYQDKIFTSIPCGDSDYVILGSTGGHFADELYDVDYNGKSILISDYLLKHILDGLSISHDYDYEEKVDGDIGCIYEYPKLLLKMELGKFNECYKEFFENKKRNISL